MSVSRAKCAAASLGVVIGGLLFALMGLQTDRVLLGGVSGAVMGGIIGYYTIANAISRVTVGAIIGASIFAILAPGIDASGLYAAPVGAVMGIVAGCLGWPWIFGILGASVGMLLGAMSAAVFCRNWPTSGISPGQCQLVGMLAGGLLTVLVGYLVQVRAAARCPPPVCERIDESPPIAEPPASD